MSYQYIDDVGHLESPHAEAHYISGSAMGLWTVFACSA